jgi:dCMP deaminase
MLNPHKVKYYPFYWAIADAAAAQSVATRHKVGAVLVMPTGMISTGWNGMPSGMDNNCEDHLVEDEANPGKVRWKTNPAVVHAERNAIDKMTREGVSTKGSVLFVTRAPCFECAKALMGLGLEAVYYREEHDDMRGLELLHHAGIHTDHESLPVDPPPTPTDPEQYHLAA